MVDAAPAEQYYSDQFPLYDSLIYRRGYHLSLSDKSETYSVEGDNAELRHYLTRLVRRSRCFSLPVRARPQRFEYNSQIL
jgi:IS1 family transposase